MKLTQAWLNVDYIHFKIVIATYRCTGGQMGDLFVTRVYFWAAFIFPIGTNGRSQFRVSTTFIAKFNSIRSFTSRVQVSKHISKSKHIFTPFETQAAYTWLIKLNTWFLSSPEQRSGDNTKKHCRGLLRPIICWMSAGSTIWKWNDTSANDCRRLLVQQ
jgi:hypothetical protein